MCPWCIIGFKQLEAASNATGIGLGIRWQPFELNPDMGPEGKGLAEHIARKYGASSEQSVENRKVIVSKADEVGFQFNFSQTSRIRNSFRAHQLIDWAESQGAQHKAKMALFTAHFTKGRDVDDLSVLANVAGEIGLDEAAARHMLEAGSHAQAVRQKERFWTDQGISGVPGMVFQQKYLVTGAQGVENYVQILQQLAQEVA